MYFYYTYILRTLPAMVREIGEVTRGKKMSEIYSAMPQAIKRHFHPLQRVSRRREVIRQFTPNWFAMTMGTGIVYLILFAQPFKFPGQHMLAEGLWIFDIALFSTFSFLFAGRLIIYPETAKPMLNHPVQSMFLGAIPMGLIPIVNGLSIFGVELFGAQALNVAHALWWLDAALAVAIASLVPYRMFTSQHHLAEQITAIWLLPIVAPEVTASSAGVLAPHFSHNVAQLLIGTGYVLWAMSVPLAFSVLTIVFLRLALHKLPHHDMAASSWLTLGPIGTGSLGLMLLGQAAVGAFHGTSLEQEAYAARDFGLIGGLLLWGAGVWWLILAIILTLRYQREGMTFNMGWWGFTFPLGVYTSATFTLFRLTSFVPFAALGVLFSFALVCFWLLVITKTLHGMWHGYLFHAPCLLNKTK